MTSEPSGRIYSAVTKYWPRIASGLIVVAGVAEVVLGENKPGFTFGFYFFAWATTTGGLWFLFDVAEKSLSADSRDRVTTRLVKADADPALRAIPSQFSGLFDRIFGEHHLNRWCFSRSCIASTVAVAVVLALGISFGFIPHPIGAVSAG